MKRGFTGSPFLVNHPQQFRAKPPNDRLPSTYDPNPKLPTRKLEEVLSETMKSLEESSRPGLEGREELSPLINNDVSVDSSMAMAMTPVNDSMALPSSPDIPSSPDTVDLKPAPSEEPGDPPRVLEQEPWVWANTLISDLQEVVRSKDQPGGEDEGRPWASMSGGQVVQRAVAGVGYTATLISAPRQSRNSSRAPLLDDDADRSVAVLRSGTSSGLVGYALDDWTILAISFFDDLELALLLQSPAGERYLGTVEYTSASFTPVAPIANQAELELALTQLVCSSWP